MHIKVLPKVSHQQILPTCYRLFHPSIPNRNGSVLFSSSAPQSALSMSPLLDHETRGLGPVDFCFEKLRILSKMMQKSIQLSRKKPLEFNESCPQKKHKELKDPMVFLGCKLPAQGLTWSHNLPALLLPSHPNQCQGQTLPFLSIPKTQNEFDHRISDAKKSPIAMLFFIGKNVDRKKSHPKTTDLFPW